MDSHLHLPGDYIQDANGKTIINPESGAHAFPSEPLFNGFFEMNLSENCQYGNPLYAMSWMFFWVIVPLFAVFVILPMLYDKTPKSPSKKFWLTIFCVWYGCFLFVNRELACAMILLLGSGPKLAQENLFGILGIGKKN